MALFTTTTTELTALLDSIHSSEAPAFFARISTLEAIKAGSAHA